MGGASLALDTAGDYISLLGEKAYLTGGDVYSPGGASLVDSTTTGHTSISKVNQATSLLTQKFNATLQKERK